MHSERSRRSARPRGQFEHLEQVGAVRYVLNLVTGLERYGFLVGLWALLLPFCGAAQTPPERKADEPTKPSIFVSFERQTIREDDTLQVEIWFSNELEYALTEVNLYIASPNFLEWHDSSCMGQVIEQSLALGPVPVKSILWHSLCVKAKPDIRVGDFNILFIFQYQWVTDKGGRLSFAASEKLLKVNLFGSESVAGVPIGLAGFIVPGLFFWFTVRIWKAGWSIDLALGEKMIYSVLVSILFVVAGYWVKELDVRSGIGVYKLLNLAGAGIALGFLAGMLDYAVREVRRRRAEAKAEAETITPGDDPVTLLGKLLRQSPDYNQPLVAIVTLNNGDEFVGSLSAETDDEMVLIGWFEVRLNGGSSRLKRKVRKYAARGNWIRVFDLARDKGLEIDAHTAIQKSVENKLQSTGDGAKRWANNQVSGSNVAPSRNQWGPLRVREGPH